MLEVNASPVTLDAVDPDARAAKRARREAAVVRRARILEEARLLKSRAVLNGSYSVPGPGGYSSVFVMRPETLDFIRRGPEGHFEGSPKLRMGDTPKLDGTPVHFSDDLEQDQVILAYKGWPYIGKEELEEPPP